MPKWMPRNIGTFFFDSISKLSFSKTKKISLIWFSHNSPGTSSNGMKINEFPVTKIQTHQLQYQSRGQSDDCITSPHQWRRWRCWQVITNDPKKNGAKATFSKTKKTPQGLFWNCWTLPLKKQNPPQKKTAKHLVNGISICLSAAWNLPQDGPNFQARRKWSQFKFR